MIFNNPRGAPELACNECGCRWFDRMTNTCYECGAPVSARDVQEFETALRKYGEARKPPSSPVDAPAKGNVDVGVGSQSE